MREVAGEPVPGQPGGGVKGAGLLEQVAGAKHHSQVVLTAQLRLGTGKVGAAAAGHHGRDARARPGGRSQHRRGACAGAEVANRGPVHDRLSAQPPGYLRQPPGKQADVEHVGPVGLLLWGKQVK